MKYCIDCKHYLIAIDNMAYCFLVKKPVNGEIYQSCFVTRKNEYECGAIANWFEPKEVKE